jgi:hypothetical protein
MKKILLFSALFLCQITFSQSYKISNSASGSLEIFEALTVNKELFGYVELRKMDLEDKLTETYKYIILDKNMNTISSGDFKEDLIKKKCYKKIYDLTYNNGFIIFCFQEIIATSQISMPLRCTYEILDVEKNKIVANGNFDKDIDITENPPKLYKNFKSYFTNSISDVGFMVREGQFNEEPIFYAIDFKAEKLWDQYNEPVEEKHKMYYQLVEKDKDYLILMATDKRNDKKISDNILVLEAKTGEKISFTGLSNEDYTLKYLDISIKDEKINIVGRYFDKQKRDKVDSDESLGIYRRIVDLKSGKILSDIYLPYSKFNSLDIDENGKVKREGYLYFQTVDLNPDGSYFLLAETLKNNKFYNELYTFLLDKDFNPIKVTPFDTKKTRGSKYSFSQDLPNKVGKAYFFYDKNDDKELELNILNFMYANKSFTTTKKDLNSDKSRINITPAKAGYIGVIEYFKDPKKEGKAMEIRLEKLNYERE